MATSKIFRKSCCLMSVSLILLLTSPPLSRAQIKKFVYSGPDGCTNDECDCTENVIKTTNEEGATVVTSTWSCDKSSPMDYIRIPSSILQIFESAVRNVYFVFSGAPESIRSVSETVCNFPTRVTNGFMSLWNGGFTESFPKTIDSLQHLGDSTKLAVHASWNALNMLTDCVFNETEMAIERLKRYFSYK
ncbi:hypothetical protein Ocin01_17036 [Orchesella cincta]|uniref:Uncharacterized protein n=1 Tax=Orchesella cincta TaxID=48709 RepID=A0A1D2M9I3_ORCCI|nr:hypothetical protein Ocin01_17036 [Orchesella cincta]